MKIVVFAPHPDDELIGAGGSILEWMEEGHDVHVIYISDGRAAYTYERRMGRLKESEETKTITEERLAEIRMKEVDDVVNFLKLPKKNVYKYKFPDQDVKSYIRDGIKRSKDIVKNASRIVLPSNNESHVDHQATHEIAVGAAKELNLPNLEFYVYALYVTNKAPTDKKIKIRTAKYNKKVFEALLLYKSQQVLDLVWLSFDVVKKRHFERFAVFKLSDKGKYYNF